MAFNLRLAPAFRARTSKRSESGSAAVEFAIIAPMLLLVLSGIYAYGGYFLTAHTVQQMANDAARAAISGLDDDERVSLATTAVQTSLSTQTFMRGDLSTVQLTRSNGAMSLRVTYDARDDIYWAFATALPLPSPSITRTATIRLGGV